MGFRINTNIAAMNAHRNATNTNIGLDKSLSSLSSGLRINKASDDASGMTIADSLRSQAQGLGQAINNANDGVAVIQTADGALDEYINIINTVRTKAIQAASDGQNTDSRAAIQADIDRLLEAADGISTQTQFNGQKLLDGTFTNKSFHIGAYAAETVNTSIDSVRIADVGGVESGLDNGSILGTIMSGGHAATTKAVDNTYRLADNELKVGGVDVTSTLVSNNQFQVLDAKNIASAISEATGIVATAETTVTSASAISAGVISGTTTNYIKINGVDLGTLTLQASDATGALTTAVNAVSDQTGVTATLENGLVTLTAKDGRNISVDAAGAGSTISQFTSSHTDLVGGATTISSTFTGELTLNAGDLVINGIDMKGTYGDNVTAGDAADKLEEAIQAIQGFESSSIANNGAITIRRNDGGDVNATMSGANTAISGTVSGLINESNKGNIELYSKNPVAIDVVTASVLGFQDGSISMAKGRERLDSVDVTTRTAAEKSIMMADSALKQLDATRSDLGSVQNQLESTIRNISVTQVNVSAAESQIRDVDFAAESANFAKFNILAQSGSYAMSQANAVQQNVMRLLQ